MGRRVFCIGLNRTGTTTFGRVTSALGLKTWGWNSTSADYTLRWHEGKLTDEMVTTISDHEAFEDLPWPMMFRELDELCPDALFVLTERRDPETWLSSMQAHIAERQPWVGDFLVYGSYDPVLDAPKFVERYISHGEMVRSYFSDRPTKLVTCCWELGDGWDKIIDFLGSEIRPTTPFPHANKRAGARLDQ